MIYTFSEFTLCTKSEKLYDKQQNEIKIEHQQYVLLLLFLENVNQLVSRDQIVEHVWAARDTSDEAIRVALKKLRDILSDNPKSPIFIKTIPKQGYKWIADVAVKQANLAWWQRHKLALLISIGVLLCTLMIVLMFTQSNSPILTSNVQVKALTTMAGSEVVADYHLKDNKLAFLHRASRGEPQQLYVKYLNTNETRRLTWDNQNYSNANWSPDGTKLAFTHYGETKKTLYVAEFNELGLLEELTKFDKPELADKSVNDWTFDGKSILLSAEFTARNTHSIFQFDLQTQTLRPISFPNTSGRGDYLAKQSEDGKYIAILRETEPSKIALVIVEANSGDAVAQHALDFTPSYIAWSLDSQEVTLSSFYSEHLRYKLKNKVVSYSPQLPQNAIDVFSYCGERCYVLRQHNGDFMDIQEIPLNSIFVEDKQLSRIIEARLFQFSGAQVLPIYLNDANDVIFASLEGTAMSIDKVSNGERHKIIELDRAYQLTSVSVSPKANMLAGSIGNRLFVKDLTHNSSQENDSTINFITDSLEQANNPVWDHKDDILYFSSFIKKVPTIFSYDLKTQARRQLLDKVLAFSPLASDSNQAFVIDQNLDAYLFIKKEEKWIAAHRITTLQSANVNRWKLRNNRLYFTQHKDFDAQLCFIALTENAQKVCQSIGKNRFRLHFDISPDNKRALFVESLSGESDLIMMRW